MLLRAVSSTFLARGDTATPVKALLVSVVINVALKILLMGRYAQVGLAFATSVGVWVNFVLLTWFAMRAGFLSFDTRLKTSAMKLAAAGLALAAVLALAAPAVIRMCASFGGLRHVAALLILAVLGAVVYGGAVIAMFGSRWIAGLRRRRARAAL